MATQIQRKPVPPRRSLYVADVQTQSVIYSHNTGDDKALKRRRSRKGWVIGTIACLVTILGLLGWFQIVVPWWQSIADRWQYGEAHISQLDANIGHGGVSHFMAEYYKGQIVVVEISKTGTHIYALGGFVSASGKPVIVLTTQDVNRDGKLDVVVIIEESHFATTLYNTGTALSKE